MRNFVVIGLVLTMAGCATRHPSASEYEKGTARNAFVECIMRAAHNLDDGKSDATAVAVGIEPICSQQFEHSIEVESQGMNPNAAALFRQKMHARQLQLVTEAVLTERSPHN